MHILLTNDDGVTAPGLLALTQAMRDLGDISVVAPSKNWSASGHVKTMHRPLRVWETQLADGTPALTSDGAPTDCVKLAIMGLVEKPIDVVISGINPHGNFGHDVTYSGTVMSAMEAAIAGLTGVAVSLDSSDIPNDASDYRPAAEATAAILLQLIHNTLPPSLFLNINIPYGPRENMHGVVITRLGSRIYRDVLERREDPRGNPYYWIGGDSPTGIAEPGTDFGAVAEGYISVTPLHLDLTAKHHIETLEALQLDIS
jgi:5'-nucleotidase